MTEQSSFRAAFGNTTTLTLEAITPKERKALANVREIFFSRDAMNTANILRKDLLLYMGAVEVSKMKMVIIDELIPSFLRKICNVYDVPPVYTFPLDDDGGEVIPAEQADELKAFWKDLEMNVFFQENMEMMRFNNVSIAYIKYLKEMDMVHIDGSFHAGNCLIETFDDYEFGIKKITYFREVGKDKYAYVWELLKMNDDGTALTLHYKYKLEKDGSIPQSPVKEKIVPDEPVAEGEDESAADDFSGPEYWPFIVYRYSERAGTFWGNAMDSLVELIRVINVLLTVANNDSIQETIRILILSFIPDGNKDESGKIKAGLTNPITPDGEIGDNEIKGQILRADLFNKEILALIEGIFGIVSNTHNIGSLLKQDIKEKLSGLALRISQAPMLRDWAHDINIMRQPDLKLLSTVVRIRNYWNEEDTLSQEAADAVQLDYQSPNIVTDDKADYELERLKWPDGTSSPLLWVMANNPEFTKDEAIAYIEKNIANYEAFNEMKPSIPGASNQDNIDIEPDVK